MPLQIGFISSSSWLGSSVLQLQFYICIVKIIFWWNKTHEALTFITTALFYHLMLQGKLCICSIYWTIINCKLNIWRQAQWNFINNEKLICIFVGKWGIFANNYDIIIIVPSVQFLLHEQQICMMYRTISGDCSVLFIK